MRIAANLVQTTETVMVNNKSAKARPRGRGSPQMEGRHALTAPAFATKDRTQDRVGSDILMPPLSPRQRTYTEQSSESISRRHAARLAKAAALDSIDRHSCVCMREKERVSARGRLYSPGCHGCGVWRNTDTLRISSTTALTVDMHAGSLD